jgi:hypothetical protein
MEKKFKAAQLQQNASISAEGLSAIVWAQDGTSSERNGKSPDRTHAERNQKANVSPQSSTLPNAAVRFSLVPYALTLEAPVAQMDRAAVS